MFDHTDGGSQHIINLGGSLLGFRSRASPWLASPGATIRILAVPKKKSNNNTKRNYVVSHYNTRSSWNHQKKFIQLEDKPRSRNKNPLLNDNTSSVPVSSNTAKGKPQAVFWLDDTPDPARLLIEGGNVYPSQILENIGAPEKMKIPFTLYNFAEYAFAARKNWEAKRNKKSMLMLQEAERMVENSAYYYKHIACIVPINWNYNPDTFSTLEPIDNIPLFSLVKKPEKKMKTKGSEDGDSDTDSDSDSDLDPSIKFPKLKNVPLIEDDTASWRLFKKFDKDYPKSIPADLKPSQMRVPVNIDHPFVSVIGNFAVDGFNKSFELFVNKDEPNHLRNPAFTKCTYYKIDRTYWFQMTILANEYEFRGVYETIVECSAKGNRSLYKFILADIKSAKKGRPSEAQSLEDEDEELPDYTGLHLRCYMSTLNCRGYNYHDPTQMIF